MVVVDTAVKSIQGRWTTEYDRPLYFVETEGLPLRLFLKLKSRLLMQPHMLLIARRSLANHPRPKCGKKSCVITT